MQDTSVVAHSEIEAYNSLKALMGGKNLFGTSEWKSITSISLPQTMCFKFFNQYVLYFYLSDFCN